MFEDNDLWISRYEVETDRATKEVTWCRMSCISLFDLNILVNINVIFGESTFHPKYCPKSQEKITMFIEIRVL